MFEPFVVKLNLYELQVIQNFAEFSLTLNMEIVRRESLVKQYNSLDELAASDQSLLAAANEAMEQAYAPYSRFIVGCALRLQNGIIIRGNNQENMAYPSGLCAERVAIFYAGANYPNIPVLEMAITAKALDYQVKGPIMSCGACLQSLSEYELKFNQPIRTLLKGDNGPIWLAEAGTKTFLPFQFFVSELKR